MMLLETSAKNRYGSSSYLKAKRAPCCFIWL